MEVLKIWRMWRQSNRRDAAECVDVRVTAEHFDALKKVNLNADSLACLTGAFVSPKAYEVMSGSPQCCPFCSGSECTLEHVVWQWNQKRLERTDWHRCQLSKSVLAGLKDGTQNMTCRSYHAWPAPGLPVYVLDGTRLIRDGWLRCGCGGCAAALVALWATSKSISSSLKALTGALWAWIKLPNCNADSWDISTHSEALELPPRRNSVLRWPVRQWPPPPWQRPSKPSSQLLW